MNDLAYWKELDSAVKSGLGLLVVLASLLAAASTSPPRLVVACESGSALHASSASPLRACRIPFTP